MRMALQMRQVQVRRKRKSGTKSMRALLKDADAVFSRWIRARDKRCVTCGSTERLQCSHLIKRGKHSVRFSPVNCNTQCASCNYRHNIYPEHYTKWFLHRYGGLVYEQLIKDAARIHKFTADELRGIIRKYGK